MTIHRYPVDPHGQVVTDDARVETLTHGQTGLFDGRGGKVYRPQVTIALSQHANGTWMWATIHHRTDGGSGYRVGPKWGQFADTRDEALWAACYELKERLAGKDHTAEIINWLDELDGTAWVQQELFA